MVTCQMELKTYQAELPQMLRSNGGKFVVIRGTQVCNFFGSYEAALDWAYEKFGLEGFFVKQVTEEEPIAHFSRALGPCEA